MRFHNWKWNELIPQPVTPPICHWMISFINSEELELQHQLGPIIPLLFCSRKSLLLLANNCDPFQSPSEVGDQPVSQPSIHWWPCRDAYLKEWQSPSSSHRNLSNYRLMTIFTTMARAINLLLNSFTAVASMTTTPYRCLLLSRPVPSMTITSSLSLYPVHPQQQQKWRGTYK